MAKVNAALLGDDAMTAEETSLMDQNREAETSSPEPESNPEPELDLEPQKAAPEPSEAEEESVQADIDPETGKARKVDYGALHSEREKRKAERAAREAAEKELATFKGRFEVIQQLVQQQTQNRQAPKQAEQIEIPDINVDPVGHFEARTRQAEAKLDEVTRWRQQQETQQTEYQNVSRITQLAQAHEVEFAAKEPAYADAAAWVREARDNELKAMGYTDPAQRLQIINSDAMQIAAQALQRNMNAAEAVFNIAKARGWQPKGPETNKQAQETPDAKKIATIAKGQEASKSLGNVNGSAPTELSIEAVLKMSDSDFAKWATDDNFRKMMGG